MELTTAIFEAVFVQPGSNAGNSERRSSFRTDEVEIKDLAHDRRFFILDLQLLLALASDAIGFVGIVTQRWSLTVPKPQGRILDHRATHVFGGLFRIIFVEKRENSDCEF
ncbi:hypothetical protein [Erythrobacter sp. A6_0]|uniref:hypothetical protein n=1 Tax=Erythrobacter sp. A6_0 TaxID=2821089 RepID=UPI001ADD0103|nr:hypothetical protein [Erythrobacter sp. A6_0]MBO9510530.1 hypothetical protein [Erythrobacter sp. A6_0]